jgi:hypothetical protein
LVIEAPRNIDSTNAVVGKERCPDDAFSSAINGEQLVSPT